MKPKSRQLLAKAQEAIEAAELLLKGGKNDFWMRLRSLEGLLSATARMENLSAWSF